MGEKKEISKIKTFLNLSMKKGTFPRINKVANSWTSASEIRNEFQQLQSTLEFDHLCNKAKKGKKKDLASDMTAQHCLGHSRNGPESPKGWHNEGKEERCRVA